MLSLRMENDLEIEPVELSVRFKEEDRPFQLVDVRTLKEYESHHFPGTIHIPLNELSMRLEELDREQETILYCHAGIRSLTALTILKNAGFQNVRHLKGGISYYFYRNSKEVSLSN